MILLVPSALRYAESTNSGQIVGTYSDGPRDHGFIRSADGSTYTIIDVPGAQYTHANGINNVGRVVGGYDGHGFIRSTDGQITSFDEPGVAAIECNGINDRGEIVGRRYYGGLFIDGFLRSADGSTFTTIRMSEGLFTYTTGINNSGEVIGWAVIGSSSGLDRGFLRHVDGSYTTIEVPGAMGSTRLTGLNNLGQIVGSGSGPFLQYANGTLVYLDVSASLINDSGTLAGDFVDSSGRSHGMIAVPLSSPGSRPQIRSLSGVIPASGFAGSDAIAPGGWIEIYGNRLAPATRSWRTSDFTGSTAPTSLEGVRVRINEQAAFLSYVQSRASECTDPFRDCGRHGLADGHERRRDERAICRNGECP